MSLFQLWLVVLGGNLGLVKMAPKLPRQNLSKPITFSFEVMSSGANITNRQGKLTNLRGGITDD